MLKLKSSILPQRIANLLLSENIHLGKNEVLLLTCCPYIYHSFTNMSFISTSGFANCCSHFGEIKVGMYKDTEFKIDNGLCLNANFDSMRYLLGNKLFNYYFDELL